MIVKVKTYKKPQFKKLFDYLVHDKERLLDDDGKSFIITHNVFGNSVEEWAEQFRENETYRINKRKNAVLLYHEIISWHKEDKISLAEMEDMAREYIQLRNPNALCVGTAHTDKSHRHVHLGISALEYHNGKTMRLSKKEFADLKKNIQQYQQRKYPALSKSVVRHGLGKAQPSPIKNGN